MGGEGGGARRGVTIYIYIYIHTYLSLFPKLRFLGFRVAIYIY